MQRFSEYNDVLNTIQDGVVDGSEPALVFEQVNDGCGNRPPLNNDKRDGLPGVGGPFLLTVATGRTTFFCCVIAGRYGDLLRRHRE